LQEPEGAKLKEDLTDAPSMVHRGMNPRIASLVSAILILTGAALYGLGIWFPVARVGQPLLLIVHAGDMTAGPENSLEAVLGAVHNGADGIEIDVAQSTDGTWWLMHDGEQISDTTTGSGSFTSLSDAEIEQLHIAGGVGYRPEMGKRFRIPRLSEVLAALSGWHGILQLDNTTATSESTVNLAHLWSSATFAGTKVIISRSPAGSKIIKGIDPSIRTLVIANPFRPPSDPYLDEWLAEASSITRPDVIALREYDVEMYTYFRRYGEDEAPAIERAWRWGATAFLTWNLPRARQIVAELER
jgi:glycerophosphoryl diester phosphodiesterase